MTIELIKKEDILVKNTKIKNKSIIIDNILSDDYNNKLKELYHGDIEQIECEGIIDKDINKVT